MNKFYRFVVCVVGFLVKILFPWTVSGSTELPEGGVVICGNHSSFLDPVYVICALGRHRQIHVLGKAELFNIPVLGGILRAIGMIPVKRGMADVTAVKDSLRVLHNQEPLLIFPEGTRVKEGQQVEAHSGAVVMAARAKAPVLPVYIERKEHHLFRKTRLVIGRPYELEFAGKKPTAEESQKLTNDLMERIRTLSETV